MIDIIKRNIVSKELLWNLVVKELKVRYKNSILGFLWALLNPLLMMIIFTIVFSVLMKGGMQIKHYPLFLLCGYLPWIFFNNSISESTTSITLNGSLINKVYFPREFLPISKILSSLVNFIFAIVVLIPFLLIFGMHLDWTIIFLPVVILLQLLFAIGLGLFFSSLNVFFRDVGNLIEILMMTWMFLTPLWYPVQLVIANAPKYLYLYLLNPMASFVVLYRYLLFNHDLPKLVGYSSMIVLLSTIIVFFGGYFVFNKLEPEFAKEL
jgi:lipopolysaccharide transport system permease protein